jgi:hypothetical protein
MLTANMKERTCGRIELKNLKLKTGKILLHYLYTGHLQAMVDMLSLIR